jgi:hypothetical protein
MSPGSKDEKSANHGLKSSPDTIPTSDELPVPARKEKSEAEKRLEQQFYDDLLSGRLLAPMAPDPEEWFYDQNGNPLEQEEFEEEEFLALGPLTPEEKEKLKK